MTRSQFASDHPAGHGLRLRPFDADSDFPLMALVANASFAADGIATVRRAEDIRGDYAAMTRWDPSRDIVMVELDGQDRHRAERDAAP
jgi:mycothiol synthase